MWAGVVKRLSRFFAFDGVSRGVRASASAAKEGEGKRRRGRRRRAENLKEFEKNLKKRLTNG